MVVRTEAPRHIYGQSKVATAVADGPLVVVWLTLRMKEGDFPARHQTPQAAKVGLPRACFKCGPHGH